MYNLNLTMAGIAIDVLVIFFIFWKHIYKSHEGKTFLTAAFAALITAIANLVSKSVINYWSGVPESAVYFFECVYLIFSVTVPTLICVFILNLVALYSKTKVVYYLMLFGPLLAEFVIILCNINTGFVFTYDKGDIVPHQGRYVLYAIAILYYLFEAVIILRYHYNIDRNRLIIIILCGLFDFCCLGVTSFFPHMLMIDFAESVTFFVFFYAIEMREILQDSVTKFYNRSTFFNDCGRAIQAKAHLGVIILKLTNYNYFVQTVGQDEVDNVMREISSRIKTATSKCYIYYCDEGTFSITKYDVNLETLENEASYLKEIVNHDIAFHDLNYHFISTICIARYPEDIKTLEELHSIVDKTFVTANKRVTLFEGEALSTASRELSVQKAIERGLEDHSFKVFYQPIWDCKKERIHSAEALVRLIDPELGYISPEEFIKVSERNGTITKIGDFVFEEVCRTISENKLADIGLEFIEVNLSTVQCLQKNLAEKFHNCLLKYNVDPNSINLEITESASILSPVSFQETIRSLKESGFKFSLDDYGTGFSNYSYIESFKFNIIKLDKSLLWSIKDYPKAQIALSNTINMLKDLDYKVLMEGVETEDQKDLIVAMGGDYIQGFYFAKALPQEDFIAYVRHFNVESMKEGQN